MEFSRTLYRCSNCEMEINLIPPVERPCPNCGGEFEEVEGHDHDEESEFNPMELGHPLLHRVPEGRRQLSPFDIDRVVAEEMPEIIASFEELLAKN